MVLKWKYFKSLLDTRRYRLHAFNRTSYYSLVATDGTQTFFCDVAISSPANDEQSDYEGTYATRSTSTTFDYLATVKTATTTATLASVGVSNLRGRHSLYIENKGTIVMYYGPTGTTESTGMAVLYPGQYVTLGVDDMLSVYVKTASSTCSYTVQEIE